MPSESKGNRCTPRRGERKSAATGLSHETHVHLFIVLFVPGIQFLRNIEILGRAQIVQQRPASAASPRPYSGMGPVFT